MAIGAYILRHQSSGYFYVGSTGNFESRKAIHLREFRKNTHYNELLQTLFNTSQDITFEFMETATREEAYALEQNLLDQYRTSPGLCNLSMTSKGRGMPMPQSHRDIISQRHTGKVVSALTRQRASDTQKGRVLTQEHRDKLSAAHTGKVLSDEAKAKISKAVVIEGVEYPSTTSAGLALGVVRTTVINRINSNSPKWSEWRLKEKSGD